MYDARVGDSSSCDRDTVSVLLGERVVVGVLVTVAWPEGECDGVPENDSETERTDSVMSSVTVGDAV